MDLLQQKQLKEAIKHRVCQKIDEHWLDIVHDYEKADKENEGLTTFPMSASIKFTAVNGKASIKSGLSWGVKRKVESLDVVALGADMFSGQEGKTE